MKLKMLLMISFLIVAIDSHASLQKTVISVRNWVCQKTMCSIQGILKAKSRVNQQRKDIEKEDRLRLEKEGEELSRQAAICVMESLIQAHERGEFFVNDEQTKK